MAYGKLYIVATPIGNLGDITLRALETLRTVDRIAAEDTRHTQKLLNHYEIKAKTISFHEHSDEKRLQKLVELLQQGEDIALVSDAGTPIISDPGYVLVRACVEAGIEVESLPGPCAAVAAVTLSGLDCGRYVFAGFLPAKQAARQAELAALAKAGLPVVLYESPGRITKLLEDVCTVYGPDVQVCAARELTKLHEEAIRTSAAKAAELLAQRGQVKGEFVLVVDAPPKQAGAGDAEIVEALKRALDAGQTRKDAVAEVTASLSCPKNKVYKLLLDIIQV